MNPNTRGGKIADLFNQFKASGNSHRAFSKLHNIFLSDATKIANNYGESWRSDLKQEALIGLYNAACKYSGPDAGFYGYAYSAMTNRAIDFYRSTHKDYVEFEKADLDGNTYKVIEPLLVETERASGEDGETYSLLDELSAQPNYVSSLTDSIDVNTHFSSSTLKKYKFSDREIRVFDLHYCQGYNVSEVAERINLSIGRTSKILNATTAKLQKIIS